MPKRYAREFRRDIRERLVDGERVSALSAESGVSPATLRLWKRRAFHATNAHISPMRCEYSHRQM